MFHAPVATDDQQEPEAPAGASAPVTFDAGNERLRAAHLHNGQVEARALFAPFFAVTAVAASLIVGWAMYGSVETTWVVGWVALVAFANWVSCRSALVAARRGASRTVRPRSKWFAIAEAVGLAGLWAALPTWAFATQSPNVQMVIGGAMAAMISTAIALAAIPAAAVAWIATFTGAFCLSYYIGGSTLDPKLTLTFALLAGTGAFSVARLTRWIFGQLKGLAKTRSEAEAIRSLLNEYEHRGVGWLWQVDAENRVAYISSRMTALLGRSTTQLVGHSLPAALGGSSALGRILLSRQPFTNLEMELATRRGTRWISLSGDPIIDVTGQFQGFRGVGQDVTDVRRTQERLTNLANMDVLSGLPNRGRVRQLLGEALSGSAGGESPCAILFLDLDGFKPVNDTFGHPKGDAVLKSVAQRLVKETGPFGQVGRMGGDEFAIVIKDAQSRHQVEDLAERLIAAIAEPFHIDKVEIRIGVSIGCAFGPVDGQSVDDLIQKADLALYQAKNQGRGTCCFFNADMQNEAEDRLRLEQDMRIGVKARQFHLLYQPLINAADQSLVGFEALIRWHHPTRGIVPPIQFIPLAEESGIIMELGEWVIEEACRAAACWPENISVAINVSAKQLIFPALPNTINDAIRRNRLQPNRLELEVTESVFMGDSANAIEVLKRLRALGVSMALDDFGTGYSSLGYLNKAVFHKLKIDGSFVREAGINKETVAIIQSIVQLAKSFRMTVTAEGVETADDFTRMRDLGCHQIQGYLFGRPMSFEKASELVLGSQRSRMSA
ncbi:MAG TPA: EAL domain-containing protein [Allosphingosinicella sp.]|nr:EAL domain-containing protein [Allosphingosinicella sp.]